MITKEPLITKPPIKQTISLKRNSPTGNTGLSLKADLTVSRHVALDNVEVCWLGKVV